MDVVILSPLELEYAAVRRFLTDVKEEACNGITYEVGHFQGKHHCYRIAITETGPGNNTLALAAERAIQHFSPAVLLLVGIAGGVKDAQVGDVVVGTKAYGYESGKVTPEGLVSRPNTHYGDRELIAKAKTVKRERAWLQRLATTVNEPGVFFGPIASGEKVIASTTSPEYRFLKTHYNDTTAIEMEAYGFAKAAFGHPQVRALNIRAISDLLDGKNANDDRNHQPMAAAHAAAFAFELLNILELENVKIKPMDAKTIAQAVVSTLFPLLKLDSVKKAGQELKAAADGTVKEIWEKVKPIFIEEIEAEDTPEEAKVTIKSNLRKKLEKDEGLKKELEALLKQAEDKGVGGSQVTISHSKNVVQGSKVNTGGGDFRVGDG